MVSWVMKRSYNCCACYSLAVYDTKFHFFTYYASATIEAFCNPVCPHVSEWVTESVHPENLLNIIKNKNQWREFHPFLVTDVFELVDVLIRFWGQKVKVTAGNDLKTLWTLYLKKQWKEFHPVLVTDFPCPPLDNIQVIAIGWRLRGNIIRTALCWIVWHNVHSQQHTYVSSPYRSNRSTDWVCQIGTLMLCIEAVA